MFDRGEETRRRILLALGCAAVSGAIATGPAWAGAAEDQDAVPIGIALSSSSIGQGLSFIALDGGFFEREGLKVRLVDARSGAGGLQAALSGSVELASGSVDSTLNATAQGKLVYVPLRLYAGQPGYLVLSKAFADKTKVPPSAPIADRLKALAGATLASPSQSSTFTVMLKNAAATGGVKIALTYIASEGMVAALSTGNVDGIIVSSPYAELTVIQGTGVTWIDGPKGEFPGTKDDDFVVPLSVPEPYLRDNRDTVRRVIRAYLAASDFVRAKPDEAAKAIRKRFSSLDDKVFDLVWDRNSAAFTKVVPTAAALRRSQDQAAGAFAAQIKALDTDSMLLSDLVKEAQSGPGRK